jgi:SAM-dependent methyltransferase
MASSRSAAPSGGRRPASAALSRSAAKEWRRRWDLQQSTGVRDREQRFDAMLEVLGTALGPRFRFLDLGTGTGSLTERIVRRFPRSRGVAVDFDPVLLRMARTALGDLGGRVRWLEVDLRARAWTRGLPAGRFDAVVSSTALHWLRRPELARLYTSLAARVRPGGILLDADGIAYPESAPTLHRLARSARDRPSRRGTEAWNDWWASVERDPRFAAEVALRHERYPHAHTGTPTPDLEGHMRTLRAAGFREVGVVWSRWENRILAAVR